MKKFDVPFIALMDSLASHAKWQPDKIAVICQDTRITYKTFNGQVNRVANGLIQLGIKKGDKVAVLMKNSVEALQTIYGIVKAGGVVVPLSSMVTGDILKMMIKDADTLALFVEAPLEGLIRQSEGILEGIMDQGCFSAGFEAEGWRSYEGWMSEQSDGEPGVELFPEDDFNIMYSSGTTGVPKGIVHTHLARYNQAYGLSPALRMNIYSISLVTTPLYTNGTWMMTIPTLFLGATLVIMPEFDPTLFLQVVQKEKCTHTFMVPTQYIVIMALPDFETHDMGSMEMALAGAAPLRLTTKKEIMQRFGCRLIELYGVTEGIATLLQPEEMEGKTGSVGKPVFGFDIRIIDDEGRELPRGEIGEIIGYSTAMFREYYKRPEETAACVWLDERGRTYLKTGDVGRLDEDGYLYILDRKKDMIISGGINIFASDIEEVIGKHKDVMDVTVIGIPHEKWGETPLGLVNPKEGAHATEEEIKAWANERLAKYQRVARIEFRESFPRNALGKVLKRILREPYWS